MRRVRYNRGDLASAVSAAKKIFDGKSLYVFATYNGYTIDSRKPPFDQRYVEVAARS